MNQANKAKFVRDVQHPQFCIITPTAYLDKFATRSGTHLTLAHLVDSDPEYTKFYKLQSTLGDRIIMDCSAFELGQSYAPEKLVELATRCGAHALVLPDYPGQPAQKTIDAAIELIPQVKAAGFATFFVPQSERGDLEDWIYAYNWAANNPDIDIIGMSILGIPNALPAIPRQYARVVMSQILFDRNIVADKHHHFLGLNAGPNVEIPALLNMGILNTCDSSNPVWTGVNGIMYDTTLSDWMGIDKQYLREVDFDEPLKRDYILKLVEHNVTKTLELFE